MDKFKQWVTDNPKLAMGGLFALLFVIAMIAGVGRAEAQEVNGSGWWFGQPLTGDSSSGQGMFVLANQVSGIVTWRRSCDEVMGCTAQPQFFQVDPVTSLGQGVTVVEVSQVLPVPEFVDFGQANEAGEIAAPMNPVAGVMTQVCMLLPSPLSCLVVETRIEWDDRELVFSGRAQ